MKIKYFIFALTALCLCACIPRSTNSPIATITITEAEIIQPTNTITLTKIPTITNTPIPTETPQPTITDLFGEAIITSTSQISRLTEGSGGYHASWSPDGQKILFTTQINGSYKLGVYEFDSDKWTLLNTDLEGDLSLGWSPTGDQFVFDAYHNGDMLHLFIADFPIDLSEQLNYKLLELQPPVFQPSFSPDGNEILYVHRNQIFLYDLGTKKAKSIPGSTGCWHPRLNPNGNTLLCTKDNNGVFDLFSIDIASGELQQLTQSIIRSDRGSWSPDGNKIVFVVDEIDNSEIWIMNVERNTTTRLISLEAKPGNISATMPAFSPDGKSIVFTFDGDLWVIENTNDKLW